MNFDIWQLLAGIGILLFGMNIFEESIRYLGGEKLKSIIKKYTDTGRKAILTGFRTTSVLQSSSLLSLLILAFAGAGILELSNAIGLIFGANIGSPVLPLLTAYIGFGSFKISALALPMIAIGGLSLIFLKNEKRIHRAKLLVGFGFLFLGLHFMKESMEAMKTAFDIEKYTNLSLFGFGIFGIIATLAIQSSGALGILVLTALDGGIIDFPSAVAISMGANIGTTFTAVLASLGGNKIKKQIALSHVIFNILSVMIGIVFFWQYIRFVNEIMGLKNNPILANARLNVVFNASTVLLFGFFLQPFTKMITWLVPNKKEGNKLHILSIDKKRTKGEFLLPALLALHKDRVYLIKSLIKYHLYVFQLPTALSYYRKNKKTQKVGHTKQVRNQRRHDALYQNIKHISDVMLEYLLPIKLHKLNKKENKMIEYLEKTIYASLGSAKSLKNIVNDIHMIKNSDNKILSSLLELVYNNQHILYDKIIDIIQKKHDENSFSTLNDILTKTKENHKNFIRQLSKYIAKHNDDTGSIEIDIPSLINLESFLYKSDKQLVTALQYTYLNNREERIFEQIK